MTAPSLNGPWEEFSKLPGAPHDTGTWEDPYLFIDERGNWHAIPHSYNAH